MRSIPRTLAIGAIAGALLLSGCGSDDDTASDETEETTTTAAEAAIEVSDVWARQSPMGTTAGAVYLNITADEDDALVGASVPEDVAGTVEIHETVMAEDGSMEESTETTMAEDMGDDMEESTGTTMAEDMSDDMSDDMGSMTMQPVDAVELPAGETVALEPGGYHIMLLDLVEPLEVGDTIEVTLTFESGAEQTVTAEVREG
jgi:copper(I)-binding protein